MKHSICSALMLGFLVFADILNVQAEDIPCEKDAISSAVVKDMQALRGKLSPETTAWLEKCKDIAGVQQILNDSKIGRVGVTPQNLSLNDKSASPQKKHVPIRANDEY